MPRALTLLATAIAATALVLAAALGSSCGKVPSPGELVADRKAERRQNLCRSWQHGRPRQTLTEAAAGGGEQKLLGAFLSPAAVDDDPDELHDALNELHRSAERLQKGENPTTVLTESEAALAATDRFYEAHCPALDAGGPATTTSA